MNQLFANTNARNQPKNWPVLNFEGGGATVVVMFSGIVIVIFSPVVVEVVVLEEEGNTVLVKISGAVLESFFVDSDVFAADVVNVESIEIGSAAKHTARYIKKNSDHIFLKKISFAPNCNCIVKKKSVFLLGKGNIRRRKNEGNNRRSKQ